MKLSTREQYGLRAMAELAQSFGEGPVPLSDIAAAQGLSLPYLEQIAAPLRRAGLLQSTRGAHGGYELAMSPDQITAGDVIRAVEGSIIPIQCVSDGNLNACEREGLCAARSVWERVRERLVDTLDSITLADL